MPAVLVEAVALLSLLLVFEPASRELRGFVRRVFGGEGERVARATRLAGEALMRAGTAREVEQALVEALRNDLEITVVRLIPTGARGGELDLRAPALAGLLAEESLVTREGVEDAVVARELDSLEAVAAFALNGHSGLVGVLTLGRQPSGASVPRIYLERLRPLADAAALALENAALVEDRLALVRQASRSERLAAIGYLAATVVHEVKNPLSSIKAVAQVLRSEASEDQTRRDLDHIVHEADRLNGSVNKLLTLGRPESERPEPTDLVALLDRVGLALEPRLRSLPADFDVRLGPGVPRVIASAEALWEVFYNLASNSLDALSPEGRIEVTRAGQGEDDGKLWIRFADDGPGVPAELAPRLFDPFVTTKQRGHGLGLAIVKSRLESMGGSVRLVASDKGTIFELRLPR